MAQDREFSAAEIAHMRLAGIPADRPGMLGEYPRMMYKKGATSDGAHALATDANGGTSHLPIQGHDGITTRIVANEDEEIQASEEGWQQSVDKAVKAVEKPATKAAA